MRISLFKPMRDICRNLAFSGLLAVMALPLSSSAEERRLVTLNSYDGLGRVTETVTKYSDHDAVLTRTTFEHDRYGNVVRERTTESARLSGRGEIEAVTNGEALETTRTYHTNCVDKLLTETDARRNIVVRNQYNPTTCLLTRTENALGEYQTFTYSNLGLLQHHKSYDASGTLITHQEYQYYANSAQVQKSITHAIGGGADITTSYTYDGAGNLQSVTDTYGNTTAALYDDMRRLTELTNANSGKDVYAYNARGLLEQIETRPEATGLGDAYSQSSRVSYTPTGRPKLVFDPSNDVTRFDYDQLGRLEYETDPSDRTTQYHYSQTNDVIGTTSGSQKPGKAIRRYDRSYVLPGVEGRLRQAKGIAGNPGISGDSAAYDTVYDYDGFQRLQKITFPDGSSESFSHDANGNIVEYIKRSGARITATYDVQNRVTQRSTPEFTYTTVYGPQDRLAREAVSDRSSDYVFSAAQDYTYDFAGREKSVKLSLNYDGHQITKYLHFEYGADAQSTTIGISDTASYAAAGLLIRNTMDTMGRLQDIAAFDAGSIRFYPIANYAYDRHGRPYSLTYPGATSTIGWRHEVDNDLRQETHRFSADADEPEIQFDYGYDSAGRLKNTDVTLASWQWSPQTDRTTQYDAANTLDQITGYTRVGEDATGETAETKTVSLSYDDNGNLNGQTTEETGSTRTLTYDADNRLLMIEEAPGLKVRYLYDARGRRVVKHIMEGAKQGITFYLHYGDQEIAEMDETGEILTYYVLGAGVDQRTAMIKNTGTCRGAFLARQADCFYYYHANRLGNVIAISHKGEVADQYLYSPFGIEEPLTASGNPFRYTGQRYDPESGYFYYKARYYDPVLGRFLQTDPVGYADQYNLYAYCGNDGLNCTDPTGEVIETVWDAANVIYGVGSAGVNAWNGNWSAAGADLAGAAVDLGATVVPGVPGGATAAIQAGRRGANAIEAANDASKVASKTNDASKSGQNFDQAREAAFEKAGMTDPDTVRFTRADPETGTITEFKGPDGASLGYDAPHPGTPGPHHDKNHISWQSGGKRRDGGAQRDNEPYSGPQHPSRRGTGDDSDLIDD